MAVELGIMVGMMALQQSVERINAPKEQKITLENIPDSEVGARRDAIKERPQGTRLSTGPGAPLRTTGLAPTAITGFNSTTGTG